MPGSKFEVGATYTWADALDKLGLAGRGPGGGGGGGGWRAVYELPDGTLILFITGQHTDYSSWITPTGELAMEARAAATKVNAKLESRRHPIHLFFRPTKSDNGGTTEFTYRGEVHYLQRDLVERSLYLFFKLDNPGNQP